MKKWAPIVNELHSATSANDVEEVLWEVLEVIRELPTNEVRKLQICIILSLRVYIYR